MIFCRERSQALGIPTGRWSGLSFASGPSGPPANYSGKISYWPDRPFTRRRERNNMVSLRARVLVQDRETLGTPAL